MGNIKMEAIITMSNQTEGKDKFCKAVQYGSRFLSYSLSNADLAKRFKALFIITRDSRKIFRMFKSINEYNFINKKINDFVWAKNKTPIVFDILSKVGFFFYWIFDNIQILSTIKFLSADPTFHAKLGALCWFFGGLFAICRLVYDLVQELSKKNEEKNEKIILKILIDLLGRFGDLLIAANGCGLMLIIGKPLNDGVLGICGLIASLISLMNMYPRKVTK